MNTCPLIWVIMGVAGSGKTVVGRLLAERLESDFLEGDRRHPWPNILKMSSQQPLDDDARHQWLLAIDDDMRRAITKNRETVITCSAEPIRPDENVIAVDGRLLPAKIVDELLNQATWLFPDLGKTWWERAEAD